jgi:AcrR family transcriptional regulator
MRTASPVRRGSEQSREKIVDAARQVFFHKGYERASIRDIEKASGLTRGAIYHHFGGKQEVYLAVLTDGLQYFRGELERIAADRELDPRVQAVALLRAYCESFRVRAQPVRLAQRFFFGSEDRQDLDPYIVQEVNGLVSECIGIVAEVLERGMKQGLFANRDPFFETVLTWSMATNAVQLTTENPRAAFLKLSWDDMMARLEQSLLDRLCAGLPSGDDP